MTSNRRIACDLSRVDRKRRSIDARSIADRRSPIANRRVFVAPPARRRRRRRLDAPRDATMARDGDVDARDDAVTVEARVVEHDAVGKRAPSPPTATRGDANAASASSDDEEAAAAQRADRARLEGCVREILRALGEDVEREGLLDTPSRVAKALMFATRGYDACATVALGTALFHETGMANAMRTTTTNEIANGTHDMVLVRDIPVFSTCAETFMPFYGVIHVGYAPNAGVIVGLSKLARVAEVYARRLQTPDGLARAVAQALHDVASPLGVGVSFTGVRLGPFGPRETQGRASTGCFATSSSVWWEEFGALVQLGGAPSELSRGIWGDDARYCGACDDDKDGVASTKGRGGAETLVDEAARRAVEGVSESVYAGVKQLLNALNLEDRVSEATDGKITLEDTARRFSTLLSAMRSGADVPFSVIEESAARDDATTNEDVIDGVCVVRDLHMSTVCEHHLLPFHGTVSVAYALGPDSSRALSRDTLQALVTRHSRRLQVQERLTRDVAEEVSKLTGGLGVMVAARAAHLCMVSRGVEKPGSSTCTVTKLGRFASEPALRSRVWERLASARR